MALEAGPRILRYRRPGGPNVFAALEDEAIEHPAIGEFRFLGGHRLWRAPELPALTYQRDHNIALSVTERDDGFTLVGVPETDGLTKTIRLSQPRPLQRRRARVAQPGRRDDHLRSVGHHPTHTRRTDVSSAIARARGPRRRAA